jgi:hypothetical protein
MVLLSASEGMAASGGETCRPRKVARGPCFDADIAASLAPDANGSWIATVAPDGQIASGQTPLQNTKLRRPGLPIAD